LPPISPSKAGDDRPIALVGLPGVGKSTLGALLAEQLGWEVRDTDALLESRMGCRISDYVASRGWAVFRHEESCLLSEVVGFHRSVLATGGGIVEKEENRRLLGTRTRVVWLRAGSATLLARLGENGDDRPLLRDDPDRNLRELALRRNRWYAELAEWVVETDRGSFRSLVQQIITHFGL